MNTPLRRVGLAMLAMIVLLLANATYIQIVKADDYRSDSRNQRVLLDEYARQRGRIQSQFGGSILASVTPTNDRLRFLRQYPDGPLYAPVTGFYSVRYGATGLERAEGRSFRWRGRYRHDLNVAETLETHLGVFSSFRPKIPEQFRSALTGRVWSQGPVAGIGFHEGYLPGRAIDG